MRVQLRSRAQHDFTQQKGGASLLTTMVLAIALIGIISGLTALSVRELRQASNNEQSKRALAGAESYASKLATELESDPQERKACNAAPGSSVRGVPFQLDSTVSSAGNSISITCATVAINPSNETLGVLKRDESFKIDLSKAYKDSPASPEKVAKMSIEWAKMSESDDNGGNFPLPGGTGSFPPATSNLSKAAALELTYVGWNSGAKVETPTGTDYNTEDYGLLPIKKLVLKPAQPQLGGAKPPNVCGPGEYSCNTGDSLNKKFNIVDVTGALSNNLIFKLTARYNGTHFRLKFYNAAGDLLMVPQSYATIDVTAKSGNLYRRVIAQKPLEQTGTYNFLDNVIFSGKNICKDMQVGADHKPVNGGTGNNTADCEN